ncbi:MAG: outer membrane protein assembly factor BamB [Gammaproteobacteria bacterium]|nr:MAG: outer membrane protein assembly factor BamB [Gammaproteobacteria bacterium]
MMTSKKWVIIVLATLGLSLGGCKGFFIGTENLTEPVDLPDNPGQVAFVHRWQKQIGDGTDEKSLHLQPLVVGNRVFVVSNDGELVALDLASGAVKWEKDIGHAIAAGVGGDQNLVVVGSEDGVLFAFDANTGQAGWRYQLSTEIVSPPIVVGGLVVARAIDGQVTAIEARSGQTVWKRDIGVADLSIRGNANGLFLDGALLYTNGRGRITLLSIADGRPLFSSPVVRGRGITMVERITDLIATPTVRNGVLFLSAYRHKTLAINLKNGDLVWESEYASAKDLFADNRYLYLVDKNSLIHAVNIQDGQLVWTNNQLEGRRISPVTGNGNGIVTIDQEGVMSIIDSRTGRIVGYQRVGGDKSYIAPQFTRQGILTYTSDGELSLVGTQ